MRARALLTAGLLLAAATAANAAPSLTIYSHDLGYVREPRTLDVRGAQDTVRLEDVSNRLDFSSVRLVPASGRVMRLAYRWDTASGDALLERAVGERVRVTSRGDRAVEGLLLAVDGSWLVIRGDDGGVSTLSRTAVEEVRLAHPTGALSLKPAIEAVLEGTRGATPAELSYLTGGLSWTAEHTLVRTGENTASWSATVLIENTTGRSYVDARVKLVAGEPSRVGGSPPPRPFEMRAMASADALQKSAMTETAFADYHLYTLDRPATLRDRETQSLVMIEPHSIAVTPRYVFRGSDPRGVFSQLEFVNSAKSGVGVPLPAGRVRAFQNDPDKALQFTGETTIGHTPVDDKVTLDLGLAFDLTAERKQMTEKKISDREREFSIQVTLRNRKPTPVVITVEEPVGGDTELVNSSLPSTRKDANTLQFTVNVPAGREVALTYTARQRW